jgi:hypothetical protein
MSELDGRFEAEAQTSQLGRVEVTYRNFQQTIYLRYLQGELFEIRPASAARRSKKAHRPRGIFPRLSFPAVVQIIVLL